MKNILLTGPPRSGKTTVIMAVVKRLSDRKCGGFYTDEIKKGSKREGFSINTLDGERGILSHVGIKGPPRVGRYGVNLADLENIAVPSLSRAIKDCGLIIMDEIGKMELFSLKFREAVRHCLDCPTPVLGTIMEAKNLYADEIKKRPDVLIIRVTTHNRDSLPEKILSHIALKDG